MFYVINIALLSITYGKNISIILLQKHRNTSSVFREMMMKDIQKDVAEKLAKWAGKKYRNKLMKETIRNIYQNKGFLWPVFVCINGRIRSGETGPPAYLMHERDMIYLHLHLLNYFIKQKRFLKVLSHFQKTLVLKIFWKKWSLKISCWKFARRKDQYGVSG